MPGSNRKKEIDLQGERLVPSLDRGASRVSKAATGGQNAVSVQHIEQRANASSPRPRPRPRGSSAGASSRQPSRAVQDGSSRAAGSSRRPQSPAISSRRPSAPPPPPDSPHEMRVVQWVRDWWHGLDAFQQQRVIGSVLLAFALFLFASLTVFNSAPVLSGIRGFLTTFFGWSAYILCLGLIVYAGFRIWESIRHESIIRNSMVLGLAIIWLLILIESRLIMGSSMSAGALAEFLVMPILGWNVGIQHVTVLGLLIIAIIFTFRITFGHVMIVVGFVGAFLQKVLLDDSRLEVDEDEDAGGGMLSPSRRPQASRYGASRSPAAYNEDEEVYEDEEDVAPVRSRTARTSRNNNAGNSKRPMARSMRRPLIQDEEEDVDPDGQTLRASYDIHDDETVAFDDHYSFDGDNENDDPLNDINVHKKQVGRVSRAPRNPKPLDLNEHTGAVRGIQQQPMLFESGDVENDDQNEMDFFPPVVDVAPPEPQPLMLDRKKPDVLDDTPPVKSPAKKSRVRNASNKAAANSGAANQAVGNLGVNLTSAWRAPGIEILNSPDMAKLQMMGEDTANLAKTIHDTLRSFRVDAEVREEDISIGPTIIRFGIRPTGKPQMILDERTGRMVPVLDADGQIVYETRTRVSRIMALQNDLALVLEAKTIRMEAPVPGRPYVGVEIPNKNSRLVTLREVLDSKEYQATKKKSMLAIGLGRDVAGLVRVGDLAKMPHLLIAGATGAGKSVCINTIIASILTQATPDDVRLLMVDPKMVELNMYNGIPHLLSPVVTETEKVVALLKNAIAEMERRYRLFSQLGVRNLDSYRKLRFERINQGDTSLNNLPAIVIIIDELADLMMAAPEEVEAMICRLAQLARATGIHLVVATQRPSVDVITGLIKANIPTRISFMVSSAVDSRTIIDMGGAERLLGRGDMLYLPADAGRPERIQGAFLTDEEAQKLADYWRQQIIEHSRLIGASVQSRPEAEPGWELRVEPEDDVDEEDDLFDKAEDIVRESGRASISLLQRRLRISYSRAARLIDLLEAEGIVGQPEPGRSRAILGGSRGDYADDENSMADVADSIVEEERSRNEFVRSQASQMSQAPQSRRPGVSRRQYRPDEDLD